MKKIIVSCTLIVAVLQAIPLKKTGQTTSYADFDDGYYQNGAVCEYDNTTKPGIVIDKVTSLEWQDDYSDNGNIIKQADWQNAIDYCTGLSLDGGGWRLPSRKELVSLRDYGRVNPAIDPKFTQVISGDYWSSTTYASSTSYAWYVGFYVGDQSHGSKSYKPYVRCVRSGQ